MKRLIYLIMLICFVQEFQAQSNSGSRIISSNLGSSGSSQTVETSKGRYYISQSIGQSSVIGTYYSSGYYLRQGYQQPTSNIKVVKEFDFTLDAKVYPNPFNQLITITFSSKMSSNISVLMFDVNAKPIYSKEFSPSQRIEIGLSDISSGSYFLNVTSNNKRYKTKLIKI